MRDLRGQALESKKTISRKAQLRELVRTSQPPNPRSNPRSHSGPGIDNKGIHSDSGHLIVNFVDDETKTDFSVNVSDSWTLELKDLIEEIQERKRSTNRGRVKALSQYTHLLMKYYAFEEITGKTGDIYPALLKGIKVDSSEKEACHALLAVALTVITVPSEVDYDYIRHELKRAYKNSKFNRVKAVAIHALSIVAPYIDASEFEIEELTHEFIEIVESDGNSVKAPDNSEVVSAACKAWGHLATYLDDLENKTETAIDSFAQQLESTDVNVQIAAGENIALLFEKNYTEREAEDGPSNVKDDECFTIDSNQVKRYEAYRQRDRLLCTLTELANESSKRIAKKDRKSLHASFSDIINTIEYPARGPRFQNATDMETGKKYGSRVKVRIRDRVSIQVDKWWKLYRLRALKEILGGGFLVHLQENCAVIDSVGLLEQKS